MFVGAVLLAVSLAGCAGTPSAKPTPTEKPMLTALHKCDLISGSEGVSLGDDNTTLKLDGAGRKGSGMAWADEQCVLKALGAKDGTIEKMQETRALDGRQDDSWGKYEASWTYHPDNGLDVLVETN